MNKKLSSHWVRGIKGKKSVYDSKGLYCQDCVGKKFDEMEKTDSSINWFVMGNRFMHDNSNPSYCTSCMREMSDDLECFCRFCRTDYKGEK